MHVCMSWIIYSSQERYSPTFISHLHNKSNFSHMSITLNKE